MAGEHEAYAEQLLQVVNDDVRVVNRYAVTLLILGTFIAVTIASTTDEMLMRADAALITLPLLNVQVPIRGTPGSFYFIAPLIILVMHCAVLLQSSLLEYRLTLFHAEITSFPDPQRGRLCTRLPSFYTIQFLEGPTPEKFLRWFSRVVTGLTLLLPLGLLLWIQIRFLPVHDLKATGFHMGMVMADAVLIIWFWPRLPGRRHRLRVRLVWWRRVLQTFRLRLGLVPLVCVCIFSIFFFCAVRAIPEQKLETRFWHPFLSQVRDLKLQEAVLTEHSLSPEVINALYEEPIKPREDALKKISLQNFLQGHDLRHANFSNAILPRMDLRAQRDEKCFQQLDESHGAEDRQRDDRCRTITQLQGADLRWVEMQAVLLDYANLRGANLAGAGVQGGMLFQVQMQGAILEHARLQDTDFRDAKLQCVQASRAQLAGADLSGAQLQAADLSDADLRGALLRDAQLQGANLSNAQLQGADLSGAILHANLQGARWQAAVLEGPSPYELSELPGEFWGGLVDKTYCRKERKEKKNNFNEGVAAPIPAAVLWPEQSVPEKDLQKALTDLVGLACDDGYITRGLIKQMQGPRRRANHCPLAKVLQACQCQNVQLLPERMKQELQAFLSECGEPKANSPDLSALLLDSRLCRSPELSR
jgi:uncharacterized protein YjbI with pentapeptide repeats